MSEPEVKAWTAKHEHQDGSVGELEVEPNEDLGGVSNPHITIKDGSDFIMVQGHEQLSQLITALKYAGAQLRWNPPDNDEDR